MAKRTNSEASALPESGPIHKRSLLLPEPTAAVIAKPTIAHLQLRHLVSCPIRRGIVYSVIGSQIFEFDLLNPQNEPRCMIVLDFNGDGPASFSATSVSSLPNAILFAVGGLKSQIHLSLHSLINPDSSTPSKPLWKHEPRLTGSVGDIVNAVIFIPTSLTDISRIEHSRADIRLIACINDHHVNIYDVYVGRDVKLADRLKLCGRIPSSTNINHASLSPDGSALLLVGDTPNVYLYTLHPGHTLTFTEITTYILPPPPISFFLRNPSIPSFFGSRACFASSWSSCGLKFVVGSQEGQLCVWDVRSAKPIFEYWVDVRSMPKSRGGQSDIWTWTGAGGDGNGPASGIREVRFSAGSDGQRELLLWTEHTHNIHVIDARTFDIATHLVIPFPNLEYLRPSAVVSSRPEVPEDTIVSLSENLGTEVETERTPSPSRSQSDWSMHDEDAEVEAGPSNMPPQRGSSPTPMHIDNDDVLFSVSDSQSRTQTQTQPIPEDETSRGELITEFTPPSPTVIPFPLSVRVSLPQGGPLSSRPTRPESSTRPHSPPSQPSHLPPNLNTPQNRIIARLRVPGPSGRERWQTSLADFSIAAAISEARVRSGTGNDEVPRTEGTGREWLPITGRTITLPLSALASLHENRDGSESSNAGETRDDRVRNVEAIIERGLALEAEAGEDPMSNETPRRSNAAEVRLRLDMARLAGLNADLEPHRIARLNRIRARADRAERAAAGATSGEEPEEIMPEIVGMCLDPTDGWVYVASTVGIVEWRVREREEGRGGATGGWR